MTGRTDRARFGAALLLLAALLASGWWLWERRDGSPAPVPPAAVTPDPPPTAPTLPAPLRPAPAGYRLAGVAVGEPESFAVIEAPDGRNTLYRANAEIPGLGRLASIEAERITVDGEAGHIELWLMPAATPTATRTRPLAASTSTATAPQDRLRTPTPIPPPVAGASTPG